ncbi:hypothetical protein IPP24_03955 [Candidatus Saccharibacteria bacterium]|nr:MAG: hypothetical protein IPP24_03955 [Candidatus Saccharibacteria bacterium]
MLVLILINHPLFWIVLMALIICFAGGGAAEGGDLGVFGFAVTAIADAFLITTLWGFIFSTRWQWLEAMASWTFF